MHGGRCCRCGRSTVHDRTRLVFRRRFPSGEYGR
jgi:hypothetical protein